MQSVTPSQKVENQRHALESKTLHALRDFTEKASILDLSKPQNLAFLKERAEVCGAALEYLFITSKIEQGVAKPEDLQHLQYDIGKLFSDKKTPLPSQEDYLQDKELLNAVQNNSSKKDSILDNAYRLINVFQEQDWSVHTNTAYIEHELLFHYLECEALVIENSIKQGVATEIDLSRHNYLCELEDTLRENKRLIIKEKTSEITPDDKVHYNHNIGILRDYDNSFISPPSPPLWTERIDQQRSQQGIRSITL